MASPDDYFDWLEEYEAGATDLELADWEIQQHARHTHDQEDAA